MRKFGCSKLAYHIGDWVVLLTIFAFAGSLGKWCPATTRPFLVFSTYSSASSSNASTLESFGGVPFYPYLKDTVSNTVLLIISVLVPFLLIIIHSSFTNIPSSKSATSAPKRWRLKVQLSNLACLGLGSSIAVTLLLTEGLKSLIAKQRPDFMGRCDSMVEEMLEKYTLSVMGNARMVTWEVCKSYWVDEGFLTRALLKEGWRSFPSGHSSLSFAGMTYISLYLAFVVFRLNFFNPPGASKCKRLLNSKPPVLVRLVLGLPILTAMYICASRYSDFKHDGIDIFCGAAIGLLGVVFGWSWYGVKQLELLWANRGEDKMDGCECQCHLEQHCARHSTVNRATDSSGVNDDVDVIQVIVDGKS